MSLIKILGIPIDMGAGRRGVDMGVSAIRLAGLQETLQALGHVVEDCGNIDVPITETLQTNSKPHYIEAIAETCRRTYKWCHCVEADQFGLVLGGDHSIAMGTIPGMARHERMGVLWIDAHTDINTPDSSPSGNAHGMPVAHLLGHGAPRLREVWGGHAILQPKDIAYIGIRSVDSRERQLVRDFGIKAFTMKDIDIHGIAAIAQQALQHLSHLNRIHVSFDIDVLDPSIAPGVGTPVRGGLNYREAHLLMELLHDSRCIKSLDIVEVNPILDVQNQTAKIAVGLAASLLGQSII